MPIDLTPFAYTPTETLVYQALLDLGPSSGYAVAKHVSIARANAYQALNGLVAKGAAALVEQNPQRFRAVQPQALLARITDVEARKLDRLADQVRGQGPEGAEALVTVSGLRSVQEVAARTIVRAEGTVRCVAPAAFLQPLIPALRKREVDGNPAQVWSVGETGTLPVAVRRELPPEAMRLFGGSVVLVHASRGGMVAALGSAPRGYWTSDELLLALIQTTIERLTA